MYRVPIKTTICNGIFMFLVIVVIEYTRSSRKEAAKEEERVQELKRIQAELKELFFAKARQETQIRELIRILHVNIPSASYEPQSYNMEDIPIHHRSGPKEDTSQSWFQSVNDLIWAAIDIVLPPEPGEERRPEVVTMASAPASCPAVQPQSQSCAPPSAVPDKKVLPMPTPVLNTKLTTSTAVSTVKDAEKKV